VRFLRIGLLASELGEHELAVASLAKACALIEADALAAHPARVRAMARERRSTWVSSAGALLRAGDREAAKLAFGRALAIDSPEIPPIELVIAPAALGSIHQTDGEFGRAVTLYERAIRHDPHNADLHARLGRCLAELGEYDRARVSLAKALAIDPAHPTAPRVLEAIEGL
jgi:tetratricopeptide (TPR) repeat protein